MTTTLMGELEVLQSRCDRLVASREERAEEADKTMARLREVSTISISGETFLAPFLAVRALERDLESGLSLGWAPREAPPSFFLPLADLCAMCHATRTEVLNSTLLPSLVAGLSWPTFWVSFPSRPLFFCWSLCILIPLYSPDTQWSNRWHAEKHTPVPPPRHTTPLLPLERTTASWRLG